VIFFIFIFIRFLIIFNARFPRNHRTRDTPSTLLLLFVVDDCCSLSAGGGHGRRDGRRGRYDARESEGRGRKKLLNKCLLLPGRISKALRDARARARLATRAAAAVPELRRRLVTVTARCCAPPKRETQRAMSDDNEPPVFGTDMYHLNDATLACRLCDVTLAKNDRFTILKHIKCAEHVLAAGRRAANLQNSRRPRPWPGSVGAVTGRAEPPTDVTNYAEYKRFLEQYTGRVVPDEGTACGPYVALCYRETVRQIRGYVTGKKIWASVDEADDGHSDSDRPVRRVVNVIVGTLEKDGPGKVFLLAVEESQDGNHARVRTVFEEAMRLLWPRGVRHDDVLLVVSGTAGHVVRAIDSARAVYTKMVHVIDATRGQHRLIERVDRPLAESIALVDGDNDGDSGGDGDGCGGGGGGNARDVTAGYETMRAVSQALDGQAAAGLPQGLSPGDLPFFRYAPVTLVDMPGSYSYYTNMLANAAQSYGFDIAKKTIVIQCNSAVLHGIRYGPARPFR